MTRTAVYLPDQPPEGGYCYLWLIDGAPVYVGKSESDPRRYHEHLVAARKVADAPMGRHSEAALVLAAGLAAGATLECQIIRDRLTPAEASAREVAEIAAIGRRDLGTGPLVNVLAGGNGMSSEDALRRSASPGWRAKQKATAQRLAADPVWRAKNKANMQRLHADPIFQAKRKAAFQRRSADPEWRARIKVMLQGRAQDPEWRAKHKAAVQRRCAEADWRARNKDKLQRLRANPEFQSKHKAAVRRATADPEWRAKNLATLRCLHADQEFKTRQLIGCRLPVSDRPRGAALARVATDLRGHEATRDALRAAKARDLGTFRAVLGPDVNAALAAFARRRAEFFRRSAP